jgi:hypothetical protein
MASTASPFRYPGGKLCMLSLTASILRANQLSEDTILNLTLVAADWLWNCSMAAM